MRNYFVILVLLLGMAAAGCITEKASDVQYKTISVAESKVKLDSGEYFILDVRTQSEYQSGHIAGAVLIPHTELDDRLDEVPKDMPILVYCRSGRRSAIASQILTDNGYTDVYNMAGGIVDWEKAGYPIQY